MIFGNSSYSGLCFHLKCHLLCNGVLCIPVSVGGDANPAENDKVSATAAAAVVKRSSSPSSMIAAACSSNNGQGPFACTQCNKVFQKQSSLIRHIYEHSGKQHSFLHIYTPGNRAYSKTSREVGAISKAQKDSKTKTTFSTTGDNKSSQKTKN